ncbi:MAG: recombinase family protein [Candidatus Dormibacter sp.]|uniref:recombinase family protein n=1 Tax=Candidatus Dormibacter sp. TaxID=2973982 RepID=UPI000DB1EA9B|nr:MAG: hypothetical protein DLM66_03665 [Candidatus Dormibacteraeota bacterium]
MLRKRIYTGDFDYGGRTYKGKYQPLISRELWQRVQEVLDNRFAKRPKKRRHEFAFSGLVSCGRWSAAPSNHESIVDIGQDHSQR